MNKYMTILVLAMAAGVLLTGPLPCPAAEEVEESIWDDDRPGPRPRRAPTRPRRIELTDEKIDQIMGNLAENDPEKAEELNRLREEDPQRFRAELIKMMKEHWAGRHRAGMEERGGPQAGGPKPARPPRATPMRRRTRGPQMGTTPRGYLEWLEKNYPEQAKELAELKEKDPELHNRKTWLAFRKHRRIYDASRRNPELGNVLKEDFELREQRDELLEQIGAATDEAEKERLVKELEDVISSRFEVILKRKQIEYERLLEKLEKLKKEVGRSQAELENWKDAQFKQVNVNARVKELVSGAEKFRWD